MKGVKKVLLVAVFLLTVASLGSRSGASRVRVASLSPPHRIVWSAMDGEWLGWRKGVTGMRLLVVNYEFPPVGGGAAMASLAAARELVALGHRVDFLTIATSTPVPPDELGDVRVHTVKAYRRGLHEVSLAGATSFVAAAALRLPGLAARHDYDLYHYYFGLPTGLLTLVPGPHRSRPFVISLRGSDVPKYDPQLTAYHKVMLP